MNRLYQTFLTLTLPMKAALVGAALLIVMLVSGATNRITSYFADRKFDKAVQQEKDLRQQEIQRGDDAEARALSAESEKAKLEMALELAGKSGEQAQKKVEDAEHRVAGQPPTPRFVE